MLVLGVMAWLVIVEACLKHDGAEKPRAVPICTQLTCILAAQCYIRVPATHLRWFSLSRGKALIVTDINKKLFVRRFLLHPCTGICESSSDGTSPDVPVIVYSNNEIAWGRQMIGSEFDGVCWWVLPKEDSSASFSFLGRRGCHD